MFHLVWESLMNTQPNQYRAIAQRGYEMNEQELNKQDATNDLTENLSDEALDRRGYSLVSGCRVPPVGGCLS